MPRTFATIALLLLTNPVHGHDRMAVVCHVAESGHVVDIELRNTSDQPLTALIHTTLWLMPAHSPPRFRINGLLITAVDPANGSSQGLFETRARSLTLPFRGVRSVRVDLERLRWSLSPKDVESPRDLWEVATPGEYDLTVQVSVDYDLTDSTHLKAGPVRVRVLQE